MAKNIVSAKTVKCTDGIDINRAVDGFRYGGLIYSVSSNHSSWLATVLIGSHQGVRDCFSISETFSIGKRRDL